MLVWSLRRKGVGELRFCARKKRRRRSGTKSGQRMAKNYKEEAGSELWAIHKGTEKETTENLSILKP